MRRVAVFGLGIAGQATATALAERSIGVRLGDDHVTGEHEAFADSIDAPLYVGHDGLALSRLLRDVDTLIPAPGVPPNHPVIIAAKNAKVQIRTEIDVAYEWEMQRAGGARPMLAVTGTDGKTTTTMLTAALLRGAGLKAAEVGNTDLPLIAALNEPHDVFVVECSSFRLQYISKFRAEAAAWLNLAPDHLDWHPTLDHYAQAKARLWSHSRTTDVAVIPFDNQLIQSFARASKARVITFGLEHADYTVNGDQLVSPQGKIAGISAMWRSMPHDITNTLAASALVLESGLMTADSIEKSLSKFTPAHHRIEFVGEFAGSRWFDDSKATSPHASLTAIRAFEKLVLIAGGRNKGLDLTEMASEPHRMAAVIAIGDDAAAIESAFSGICDVSRASSMTEAVRLAAGYAKPGIDVVLSPGCTSFDWYNNYGERGSDFQKNVRTFFGDDESQPRVEDTAQDEGSE